MRIVSITLATFLASTYWASAVTQERFTYSQICKAGIGVVMGSDAQIMIAGLHEPEDGGGLLVSYMREDDGQPFMYKCRLYEERIIWGNLDGRWRNDTADSVITWFVDGKELVIQIQFNDGSVVEKTFTSSQLSQE